jgi:DNA-binding protein H-NS
MRVLVAGNPGISSDTNGQSFYDELDKSRMKSNSIPYKQEQRQAAVATGIMKGSRMATVNVDKMSLKDLIELEAKVQKAISAARDRERAEVKQAMAALAEKRGFSVSELFGGRGRGKGSAAKYANPDNRAETWTGRGRKPNWLVAKLKKGANIADFAI